MKTKITEHTEEHRGKADILCEVSSVKLGDLCGDEVIHAR
jgi:hypothetical protein